MTYRLNLTVVSFVTGVSLLMPFSVAGGMQAVFVEKNETWGQTRNFIEVVRPEPAVMQQQRQLKKRWLAEEYGQDKQRGVQVLSVPQRVDFSLAEFASDSEQWYQSGLFIELQLRRRQHLTIGKIYQVSRRGQLFGQAAVVSEEVPVWEEWNWDVERNIAAGEKVILSLISDRTGGACGWGSVCGTVSERGVIRFSLLPFMEQGLARSRGLSFIASCPALDLSVEVIVPKDVFLEAKRRSL